MAGVGKEDVFWFEISVNDTVKVQVLQSEHYFSCIESDGFGGEFVVDLREAEGVKITTGAIIYDEESEAVVLEGSMEGRQGRVRGKHRDNFLFMEGEAKGRRGGESLEGKKARRRKVEGKKNDACSAMAKGAEGQIRLAEESRGGGGGIWLLKHGMRSAAKSSQEGGVAAGY